MKIEYLGVSEKGIKTYALENANGMRAEIITYGARIAKLFVKDKNGNLIDVVAGFDNVDSFMGDENPYFNAVIGRVCNRIGGAKFTLNGKEYPLYKNDGNNHLHGGKVGFDSQLWDAEIVDNGLKLSRVSEDGEEGYPARLDVSVTYTLTDDNALELRYCAFAHGDTHCSLTNHAYFNLDGDFKSVLKHKVVIDADYVTPVDDELIPHGEKRNIKNTAFDFTAQKEIGKDIKANEHMLEIAKGYDFNYVLNGSGVRKVASAKAENSGVKMDVVTDRACMQFYTGNFLDGLQGKKTYGYQSAFCMETQGYPNACNVSEFESTLLKSGETYSAYTAYNFSI